MIKVSLRNFWGRRGVTDNAPDLNSKFSGLKQLAFHIREVFVSQFLSVDYVF